MSNVRPAENGVEDIETIERKHFQEVVNAFRNYRFHNLKKLFRTMKYLLSLPEHQQELLKDYKTRLHKVRTGIEHNSEIIKLILQDVPHMFENKNHSEEVNSQANQIPQYEIDKIQSVLKQIHREWSLEGKMERDTAFKPILDEIAERFPERHRNVHILVPGAGLGRLAYEIAKRGYVCQGNELSLHMLFVSNFILNKCRGSHLHRIYPWVTITCNLMSSEDQVQMTSFPDVNPFEICNSEFSMAAGSFTEIYTTKNSWDCIATCFFIDTACNVIEYIEVMWKILKPGGYWINLGPLLYHHADMPNIDSIEPSYEEIRFIIEKIGFVYLKEQTGLRTYYCHNPSSMLSYEYKSVFFVCQKPLMYAS